VRLVRAEVERSLPPPPAQTAAVFPAPLSATAIALIANASPGEPQGPAGASTKRDIAAWLALLISALAA